MKEHPKVTMKDVAQHCGISVSTVSMILNRKPGVSFSDETIHRVLDAAQELGYHHRGKSSVFAPSSSRSRDIVAVFCPNMSNAYYSTIFQAIEQAAYLKGVRTILITTFRDPEIETQMVREVLAMGVKGIIFTMMPNNPQFVEQVALSFPVVIIGDKTSSYDVTQIDTNNYAAGVLLAEHLYRLGHRQVAFLSTTLGTDLSLAMRRQRLNAIRDTFQTLCKNEPFRVVSKEEKIAPEQERKNINLEHGVGYNLCRQCLEDRHMDGITAFIGNNDMVAYGIMDAILKKGYLIPKDYSVCGFDNVFASSLRPISLTSVENYMESKGKKAFEMLYEKLDSCEAPSGNKNSYFVHIEYKPQLVVRSSTGRPNSNF